MGMLSINTNVGALKAADSAYSVNKSMETSMQRLSSGKRINGAVDDAAGLQISQRLTGEIRGFNQAARNAADAQSLLATAEGAYAEMHNILQRLRELAVQGSSGTNSTADRTALNSEVTSLEAEIDRIANDTTWGGIQLMDGTQDSGVFTFQVGPDGGDTIVHTLPDVNDHTASGTFALTGDVTTRVKASAYIAMADTAISFVGTEREQIGAVMNRLDYTMANLTNMSTNLSLAKGRIEDADFAAESANLARTQVLQQASMSMLAQANASKQNILALFQ
ncbi:flagellin [Paracoccaceae bacterium]|nr:flagellin [Paracoccaceae bacterium]